MIISWRRRVVTFVAVIALWPWPSAHAQSVSLVMPMSAVSADAWEALQGGRLREAERMFARALKAAPEDTASLVGAAVTARRLGHGSQARLWLTRALQVDPSLQAASLMLGQMARESGDLDTALRVYEAALVRAPDSPDLVAGADACRTELKRLTRWPGDLGGETRLYFEGPADAETATLALEAAAKARDRIGSALGVILPDRVTVVLRTSKNPRRPSADAPEWSSSQFDGRIVMEVQPPVKDRIEFERMLTHEYAHAVLRGVAPSGVPRWIDEGLAALLEPGGLARARQDLAGKPLLPFDALEQSFASLPVTQVTSAYAQSALAAARMIERGGIPGVLGLMGDLAAGDRFDLAFRARIGVSFDAFQREFTAGRSQ